MGGYIVIGIIVAYCALVIYNKIRDIKRGKICSCSCGDCPSKGKCSKED